MTGAPAFTRAKLTQRGKSIPSQTCKRPTHKKVVAEFEVALEEGAASIKVDGKMVDNAMYVQAKAVLDRFGV